MVVGANSFELVIDRRTQIFGPDLVTKVENKVRVIQANLKAAQSRQKSYADKRRKPLKFEVGDHVYLRVLQQNVFKDSV